MVALSAPVYLTVEPEVYAENIKIEAVPDFQKGTATLRTKLRVRNASQKSVSPKAALTISLEGKNIPLNWKHQTTSIAAGQNPCTRVRGNPYGRAGKNYGILIPQISII